MDNDKTLDGFHDSYLIGIDVDHLTNSITLKLRLGDTVTSLIFHGATRFLLTEMLIQNIVYDIKDLMPGSDAHQHAKALLDKSYWKVKKPGSRIITITASLGAELLIEFESLEKLIH
ncbi:hypothetical protein BJG93_00530 [Paraburkholderia sprentiae WSM5005]|uniref:Uncharacterized protein n=1 Tax=Paraburkholderia sprentiae WSM5005 TaxID=754502 RepID=A0A1I9YCM0_9BURK|nr:hypothetical protein [Paraburkholderia sprentiae]APA84053.1 hypothetical protein BJG93_00530 [Paraburkholderia sprentiae WSM5005]